MVETAQYSYPKAYSNEVDILAQWFLNSSNMLKLRYWLKKNYGISSRQDFEDIVGTVTEKACKWVGKNGLPQNSKLATWIYAVTWRYVIELGRKENRTLKIFGNPEEIDSGGSRYITYQFHESAESTYAVREELEILSKSLDLLTPKHRNVIVLHTFKELTYKEIASLEGVSVGVVMSRLHYARKYLRQMLNSTVSKDTPKSEHTQTSKSSIPNLEATLQDGIGNMHTKSIDGTAHINREHNGNSLNRKTNVYPLHQPSNQKHYGRKSNGTAKTLERSVANLR